MKGITQRHIDDLNTILDAQLDFYDYQICRYYNDTSIDLRANYEYTYRNLGFDEPEHDNIAPSAYFNVTKSVIDALVSKLYNQKVRPYFTPINGTWKTKRVVNDVQQYFDVLYDNQKINKKICDTFRMACIFGRGHLLINEFKKSITPLSPHCVALLNSEIRYGKPRCCMIRFLHMPVEELQYYGIPIPNDRKTVDFYWYIDTDIHKQIFFIDRLRVKANVYKPTELPFLTLYYNEPVFGNSTTSIVQELNGIQDQIIKIAAKTSAAAQLSPANQTFVLEGSSLTPKDLDNRAGMVYGIKMPVGVNTPPVVSVAPPIFDRQWQEWLNFLIDKAYAMIGISELSAMGKKQAGLNSGVSLQTFEDIESDRFETQVTHYINAFIDLAKLLIEILDEDSDILPQSINNSSLKWKDVKDQSDLFKVQYSAATQMSKDPSTNVQTIVQMAQTGQIPVYKVARAMNNPDMIEATKAAAAIGDGIQQCIARAIEKKEYDIPEWIENDALLQEIKVVENELYSSLSDDKENDKLVEESLKRVLLLEGQLMVRMNETTPVQPVDDNINEGQIEVPPTEETTDDLANASEIQPTEQENYANTDETGDV